MAGTEYKFKVAAVNKWGTGIFSEVVTVLAASIPATVDPADPWFLQANKACSHRYYNMTTVARGQLYYVFITELRFFKALKRQP